MIMAAMGTVLSIDHAARAAKIDRFGELQRLVKEHKPIAAEYKSLGDEIERWYESHPADQPVLAEGLLFSLQISPRAEERAIHDKRKLRRLMGAEKFFELCSIALKHVDALVDKSMHHLFLTAERTGRRRLDAVAKATLPQQAA